MDREIYSTRDWRELPRDGECVISFLFGEAVGPCRGKVHRHHVDPEDPGSRSFQVCAGHHPKVHAALRRLLFRSQWKPCPHRPGSHRYSSGREACERRLNRELLEELHASS